MLMTNEQFQLTLGFIVDSLEADEVEYLYSVIDDKYKDDLKQILTAITELNECQDFESVEIKRTMRTAVELGIPIYQIHDRLVEDIEDYEELAEYHIDNEEFRFPEYFVTNMHETGKALVKCGMYKYKNGFFFINYNQDEECI